SHRPFTLTRTKLERTIAPVFVGREKKTVRSTESAMSSTSHLSSCGFVFACQCFFSANGTAVCIPHRRGLPIYDPSSTRKHFHDGVWRQQQWCFRYSEVAPLRSLHLAPS